MTVGRILVNDNDKGSGFALASPHSEYTRIALTANHVVRGQEASSFQFVTQAGQKISVERVERDKDLDVAVLHLGEDVAEGLAVGRAVKGAAWQVEAQPLGNDPKLTGTVTDTHRQFVKGQGHPAMYVVQLQVDQILNEYKGYSGSPVALQSASGAVIGVLIQQLPSRFPGPIGQPRPATNVLYAIPIQDVLNRFGLTYKRIEPHIQTRVPFMVEDLPLDYVPRLQKYEALIEKLLDQRREEPVAITVALRGAGGYGKTTMARAICHDERVQQEFDDGILWMKLGEHPGNLVGKVEDLIETLSNERPGFTGIDAAGARLAELLADRDTLLVVDDVWDGMHLKPFLRGGKRCAHLVTTRNVGALPANAKSLVVDAMQKDEAIQLLSFGLQAGPFTATEMEALRALVARLGKWALLLKLANGVLRDRVGRGESLANALAYINKALNKRGLTAFDAENAQSRDAAVSATLRVSFELLQREQYTRYQEVAVFPEDFDIPLVTLQKLWGATGGLDDVDTEELCQKLYRHSLLLNFDLATRTIRLHDVIRSYLQKAVGAALPALHAQLLDAYALKRWADLPGDEPYLWDHLAGHLAAAGRLEELVATVKDLRYLANKTLGRTAYATEADLALAEQWVPSDVPLRLLTSTLTNMGHLLNRCTTYNDLAPVLYSRLVHLQELSNLCQAFEQDIPRPFLASWHRLPDLPDPALIRTLAGHTGWVRGCAISPAGDTIVSASIDDTLKVWDAHTGEELRTLVGHTGVVNGCAISPAGDTIVSASDDETLKVWDAHTGEELRTLVGHTGWVRGCAISPAGDTIVSASTDQTLRVWDARTGACLSTLYVNGLLLACAFHPDGEHIVAAGAGGVYFLRWVR